MLWTAIFVCAAGSLAWIERGSAAARRLLWGVPPVDDAFRTETRFLAVAFSRLTSGEEPFAMSGRRFYDALAALRAKGYVSIGLADVEALYRRGRRLPPRSILIALDRDNPESVRLADVALKRLRLRAVVFLDRNRGNDARLHRYSLSPHALDQMARGGAWEFGWFADSAPIAIPARAMAILDPDSGAAWTRDGALCPMRFLGARAGYNDLRNRLDALRIMRLRPELSAEDIVFSIEAAWPREKAFSDDFTGQKLGMDWVAEWGVIAAGHGRMALLPTSKQTGASVLLSGTEDWRDLALEFEVRKYHRSLWAYAREGLDGSFVRVGARGGYWYIQQKTAREAAPISLAREPVRGLPARVRVVLKDRFAVVDLDGRMAFRKAVELSTAVDHGRVALGVFDRDPRAAMGILSSFSVRPLSRRWLSLNVDGTLGEFDPDASERLREQSVFSFALSPRWLSIAEDGGIRRVGKDPDFVRQLAGFNRCLLVPMAFLSSSRLALLGEPVSAGRLLDGLVAAAEDLEGAGLNLRIPGALMRREEALRFIAELARRLGERGKRLWVTLDGPADPPGPWIATVAGILRPGRRPMSGVEQLQFYGRSAD